MINRRLLLLLAVILSYGLISACSVLPKEQGIEQVKLLTVEQVTNCQKVGSTYTTVLYKVGFIERDPKVVEQDLIVLAKNDAVRMQANVIVALTELDKGQMQFAIYRCLD